MHVGICNVFNLCQNDFCKVADSGLYSLEFWLRNTDPGLKKHNLWNHYQKWSFFYIFQFFFTRRHLSC